MIETDTFDRSRYVVADVKRGKAMLLAFFIAVFLGFLSGLLPGGAGFVGGLLLVIVLFAGVYLVNRSDHETKKKTDYFIVFFITLITFFGFWIISLNIP